MSENTPVFCRGDHVAGKYRVERVLGIGGMGIVLAATHVQLDVPVAVKVLLPEPCKNPEAVARFLREARAAMEIESDHVARVLDVGVIDAGHAPPEYAKAVSGAPFYVMDLLTGMDLEEMVSNFGPLSVERAVEYVVQACDALVEAHALGIVHRDIKPANLFVTRRCDGRELVKVLDFGVSTASAAARRNADLTSQGTMLGSPVYMSPEQIRNAKSVDGRSDIWSLGVLLYEVLTGELPFEGATLASLYIAISLEAPARPRTPEIPRGLEDVIMRCLEKDPAARFQDVGALAAAIAPYGSESARRHARRVFARCDDLRPTIEDSHPNGRVTRRSLLPPLARPRSTVRLPPPAPPDVDVERTTELAPVERHARGRGALVGALLLVMVLVAAFLLVQHSVVALRL